MIARFPPTDPQVEFWHDWDTANLPAPLRPGGRAIAMLEDPEGHEVELLASD